MSGVQGHKKPRFAFQVDLDVESLNHQECFVLDMGDRIYKFVVILPLHLIERGDSASHKCFLQGEAASPFDRTAAANFADYLEKSKNGVATLEDANE